MMCRRCRNDAELPSQLCDPCTAEKGRKDAVKAVGALSNVTAEDAWREALRESIGDGEDPTWDN